MQVVLPFHHFFMVWKVWENAWKCAISDSNQAWNGRRTLSSFHFHMQIFFRSINTYFNAHLARWSILNWIYNMHEAHCFLWQNYIFQVWCHKNLHLQTRETKKIAHCELRSEKAIISLWKIMTETSFTQNPLSEKNNLYVIFGTISVALSILPKIEEENPFLKEEN